MGSTTNIVPRACRNCRIRKIRCSREIPCANCITSKITCQESTKDATRRSTTARSVPEKKQALLATDITEFRSLAGIGSPQVVDKISGLRKLLERKASDGDASQPREWKPSSSIALQENLPPADFVIRLLRAAQGKLLSLFPTYMKQVEDLCRRVYFPVQAVTIGELTLLSAMLAVILCVFQSFPRPEFSDQEITKYYAACKENRLTGIETYEVNMIPSFEHCLVLYIAASLPFLPDRVQRGYIEATID
ncbi:hypothetical protein CEP52_005713 [Fusarium oligoseptatum]|uniref:Zn(2)-C6 fungal-type domain-containing protein n=1 Tax=Fusarium oligoseptatum TaxID=2604345 RepID=A0A428TX19_9HYPO|nr:hypothetical protein CEP52_005713 [Fusarium oligoseptatum]